MHLSMISFGANCPTSPAEHQGLTRGQTVPEAAAGPCWARSSPTGSRAPTAHRHHGAFPSAWPTRAGSEQGWGSLLPRLVPTDNKTLTAISCKVSSAFQWQSPLTPLILNEALKQKCKYVNDHSSHLTQDLNSLAQTNLFFSCFFLKLLEEAHHKRSHSKTTRQK